MAAIVGGVVAGDWWVALPEEAQATYVGRKVCADCHQEQHRQWTGSHHDHAMEHATDESVLGDFNDAILTHHEITSRMFRRGEKFFVNTEGPDGKLADFEVKFTFGYTPLQQYLVEFDRPPDMPENEISRLQTLRLCWNTVKKEWFYLPPPDVPERLAPDDDLHWTGVAQRWNNMCADCHSTNLRRNYDVAAGLFHTTYSEIDVSCEACHGPGSLHVQLAERGGIFKWDRKRGHALSDLKGTDNKAEVQTCAACHSRRRVIREGFPGGEKFYDYFANELLTLNSYHADGQILDEVYELGSFCQSKMYHKGIRCTDCHQPHSLKLKHEGNKLCTSCHAHPASRFDSFNHHHHKEGTAGAQCVSCHMPTTTYMEVDPRRDHSLRVPRPDLSVQHGTPNACTGCHIRDVKLPATVDTTKLKEYADWLRVAREGDETIKAELTKLDQWSSQHINRWYGAGKRDATHFATALAAARQHDPDAAKKLSDLLRDRRQPAIARATAALQLGEYAEPESPVVEALGEALHDPDPQVRGAAIMSLGNASDGELARYVVPRYQDSMTYVRLEAARGTAHLNAEDLKSLDVRKREQLLRDFEQSQLIEGDRAHAHLVLGSMYEALQDEERAEKAYRQAMLVEPRATGARRNLAALLERRMDYFKQQTAQATQAGDRRAAEAAGIRAGEVFAEIERLRREELMALERDAKLAPRNAGIQNLLGLSLYLHGRKAEAETALKRACELEPTVPYFAYQLAIFYRDAGRAQDALAWARKAAALQPRSRPFAQLVAELEQERK